VFSSSSDRSRKKRISKSKLKAQGMECRRPGVVREDGGTNSALIYWRREKGSTYEAIRETQAEIREKVNPVGVAWTRRKMYGRCDRST